MKILNTLAIAASISLIAGSAFALPAKNQTYKAYNFSQTSLFAPNIATRITVIDNAGVPIQAAVTDTSVQVSLLPTRPYNVGYITNTDYDGDTDLTIRDANGQIIEVQVWNHAVVNVRYNGNGELTIDQISK